MATGQSTGRPVEYDISSRTAQAEGTTTARSLRDRFDDVLNVRDFGAKGDGTTNDATAINAALSAAAATGITEVVAPPGVYSLRASVVIPSGVTFRAMNGAVLKAAGPWFSPIVKMWGVTNSGIVGFKIDGDAVARGLGPSDPSMDGIDISSSSYCVAERNWIVNVGRPTDPGGQGILVDAWDVGETFSDVDVLFPQLKPKAPSRFNRVAYNRIDDPGELLYFPIRLLTTWYHLTSYTYTSPCEHNLVVGNQITGGNWNAIEIAGPATRHNQIIDNFVRDTHQSGIEADKGASYNSFIGNVIDGVTAKKAGSLDNFQNAGGMRAQGWDDGTYTWIGSRNRFIGNTIRNIHGGPSPAIAHGFQAAHSDENVFESNTIENVWRDGDNVGQGVVFYSPTNRNIIRGNTIAGVYYGVMPWANNASSLDGQVIEDNAITAHTSGIRTTLNVGQTGTCDDWQVRRNLVTADTPATGDGITVDSVNTSRCIVQENRVHSWNNGIIIRGPATLVADNTVKDATTYGIITQANSDLDTVVRNNGVVGTLPTTPYSFAVQTQSYGNRKTAQSSGAGVAEQHTTRQFTGQTVPTGGTRGDIWWSSQPTTTGALGAVATGTGVWRSFAPELLVTSNPTFGATVNIDASNSHRFVITANSGSAFTVASPTNGTTGQRITIVVKNTSGGALGTVTWGATYKLGTWTSPATANSRTITFIYDGTNWIETSRTPSDVPS